MDRILFRAASREVQKGAPPPQTKIPPHQTAQHAYSNSRFPCGSFILVSFFFEDQQKTRKKVDQFGAMTFFIFLKINRELGRK